jgi:hypothetical protein
MDAEDLRDFQQRCIAARQRFQELAVRATPVAKIKEIAERMGLAVADEMTQVGDFELAHAFDLAIYHAPPGRSRSIDRVARHHAALRTEAALVLNGLLQSWFSVFRVIGPHPEAGLLLGDALLGGEVWVIDEGLTEEGVPGAVIATRLARIHGFAITCGVAATLDEDRLASFQALIGSGDVDAWALASDSRFAQAIWRRSLGT